MGKESTAKAAATSAILAIAFTPLDQAKNIVLSGATGGTRKGLTAELAGAFLPPARGAAFNLDHFKFLYRSIGAYAPQKVATGFITPFIAVTTADHLKTTGMSSSIAGACGGAIAAVTEAGLSQPIERIKVLLQTQKSMTYTRAFSEINSNGAKGWSAGLWPTIVRNLSGAPLTWMSFIGVRDMMKDSQGESSAIGDTAAAISSMLARILVSQPAERMKVYEQTKPQAAPSISWPKLFTSGEWSRGLGARLTISGSKFAFQQFILARALSYFEKISNDYEEIESYGSLDYGAGPSSR